MIYMLHGVGHVWQKLPGYSLAKKRSSLLVVVMIPLDSGLGEWTLTTRQVSDIRQQSSPDLRSSHTCPTVGRDKQTLQNDCQTVPPVFITTIRPVATSRGRQTETSQRVQYHKVPE